MSGSCTCRRCEISKKLTLILTLTAKNTPLLFPIHGAFASNICLRDALHAHVFSFTHNAVVLSHFRCVHPKSDKNFLILKFYESKQPSLTQDLKWSLNKVVHYKSSLSPASNWFVTLYYIIQFNSIQYFISIILKTTIKKHQNTQ